MQELIASTTLKELIVADAVRAARVSGTQGGYHIVIQYGNAERTVSARTRHGAVNPRLFRSLDAVSRYLRELGLTRYEVDDSGYVEQDGPKRSDRTEAMKKMHAAANHTRWIQTQLQEAIADARSDKADWRDAKEVDRWLDSWGSDNEQAPT